MGHIISFWKSRSLVQRIIMGLIVGIILAIMASKKLSFVALFGTLFVGALKAVAPVLVLFLVMSALLQREKGQKTNLKTIVILYIVGTVAAGSLAVVASFVFKPGITLAKSADTDLTPPQGIYEIFENVLNKIVCNPIDALMNANFLGVLAWALILGMALRYCAPSTKTVISDVSDGLTKIVEWVIKFAPLGVMGLVFNSIAETGLKALGQYGKLIALLVGCMLFDALIINPIIVLITARMNPYPLIFKAIKVSGMTAFFTRSSAANIPVNMELCEDMGLDRDTYAISIPLGATINMGGAAITISVLTLAAVHTLNIDVSLPQALLLCVISAISACGASGVSGGSLLLIPMAASLFGIPTDTAMLIVGVGFIVGVIQDSCETALNSSVDVVFTAAAEYREKRFKLRTGRTRTE